MGKLRTFLATTSGGKAIEKEISDNELAALQIKQEAEEAALQEADMNELILIERANTDTTIPSPPTILSAVASLDSEIQEGVARSVSISFSWVEPTTNEDVTELLDLSHYELHRSISGSNSWSSVSSIKKGQTTFLLRGQTLDTAYDWRLRAVDFRGNYSIWAEATSTAVSPTLPDPVTNVTLSSLSSGFVLGSCDPVTRPDLEGFVVQYAISTEEGGSVYGAWSTDRFFSISSGVKPYFNIRVPAKYNIKIRVKASVYCGVSLETFVESSPCLVTGVSESDFSDAAVGDITGNEMRYRDNAVISYIDSTHYAGFGSIGASYYGLYVKGGAIEVETASGAVTIESTGIFCTVDAETDPRFELTSSGLTLRSADIRVNDGQIVIQSGTDELKMDATNGIRSIVGGSTVVKLDKTGITIDSTTEGFRIKDGSNRICFADKTGFHFRNADDTADVAILGKVATGVYGLATGIPDTIGSPCVVISDSGDSSFMKFYTGGTYENSPGYIGSYIDATAYGLEILAPDGDNSGSTVGYQPRIKMATLADHQGSGMYSSYISLETSCGGISVTGHDDGAGNTESYVNLDGITAVHQGSFSVEGASLLSTSDIYMKPGTGGGRKIRLFSWYVSTNNVMKLVARCYNTDGVQYGSELVIATWSNVT